VRDWLAVELTGAFKSPKARVLWQGGVFKIFDKRGLIGQLVGNSPVKRPGWRRSWEADTEHGKLYLQGRCIACGGWIRVATKSKESLWEEKPKP
jgi:hypothetical protein